MIADRWEHGSEYHRLDVEPPAATDNPWSGQHVLYGCGRDALRAVVSKGLKERGWRRLWVPHYYCGDVIAAILRSGIECVPYPHSPLLRELELSSLPIQSCDALLVVNYFGLLDCIDSQALPVDVVEDHTHDPWSDWAWNSSAEYCVASYRKALPVPDGAVVWSPRDAPLPERVVTSPEHELAAARKAMAMHLKRLYLDGWPVEKDQYLRLFSAGERSMGTGSLSGITQFTSALLPLFPVAKWREMRRRNFFRLSRSLGDMPGPEVLQPDSDACVPFSLLLVFDRQTERERVRTDLIGRRVYPAILWPTGKLIRPPVGSLDEKLGERILSIHCDYRYTVEDMDSVAAVLQSALANVAASR